MFQELKTRIWLSSVRKRLSPRPEFRRVLALRIRDEQKRAGVRLPLYQKISTRNLAVGFLVLVVAFGATTTYAYTNETVVDGNPLYPLRMVVENLEETATVTPSAKAKLRLRRASRRLQEAAQILKTRPGFVGPTLRKVEDELDHTVDDVYRMETPEQKKEALDMIGKQDEVVAKKLTEFSDKHPRATRWVLRTRIAASADYLEKQVAKTPDPVEQKVWEARLERRKKLLERVNIPVTDQDKD